jgi:hypothetical protein
MALLFSCPLRVFSRRQVYRGRKTRLSPVQSTGAWHYVEVPESSGGARAPLSTPLLRQHRAGLPYFSRRAVIRAAALAAGAAAVGAPLAACSGEEPAPDPLLAHAQAARADAEAAMAAIAVAPRQSEQLRLAAAQRTEHADALEAEINRAAGVTPEPSEEPAAIDPAGAAGPSVEDVRVRIADAGTTGGNLAMQLDGYRAGLLASISASCRTLVEVVLA